MWQVVAVLACALGMGSKEAMVTAPIAVVLFDRAFLFDSFRAAFRERWRLYAALAATWIILAVLLSTSPRPNSAGFSAGVSSWTYLLNQAPQITRYLGLAVWPKSLVAFYGWPVSLSVTDVLPQAAFVLVLIVLTFAALKWRPQVGFLGLWFFMTLAPTSSVVPIATEVGAERRMYLPLIALVVLVVVGAVRVWDAIRPRLGIHAQTVRFATFTATLVLGVVTAALAMGTVARNSEYASELALAQSTLDRYPTPFARHWLAECLIKAGRREEAIVQLRQAVPDAPRAHYTLGVELFKDRKLDEAIYHLKEFLAKQPRLAWASNAYGLLGQSYWSQENFPAAIEAFRALLARTPNNPIAHYSLAEVLVGNKQFDEAIDHYRVYLGSHPEDPSALNSFGLALALAGREDEALAPLERAVKLNPRVGPFQHNLALALLAKNQVQEALKHARLAAELQPESAESQNLVRTLERSLQGVR